jgi:dTDP-4-dehydrorhamnose 3,5-epimerase
MDVLSLAISDVKVITPKKFGDHRGFFSEVFNAASLRTAGIDHSWVQDNHSLSGPAGTVRALHYQLPPMAQAKLVRVVRGAVLDVAVDVRRGSPTFGQHVSCELSADNWKQMYVPVGFAHGFVTLQPNTEVIYKVSNPYSPPHERGIIWNDPALKIAWGVDASVAVLSDRDRVHPLLANAVDLF